MGGRNSKGIQRNVASNSIRRKSNDSESVVLEPLPEPEAPAETDARLPLDARQVFKLKKSWKGIKRNMHDTAVEMFVR